MIGKKVQIYTEQGDLFSEGIITDFKNGKIYIKYLGEKLRDQYGYFDFDLVFDIDKIEENTRIQIMED